MALKLKTGPALSPITLAEAKGWCRAEDDEQDVMIQALIDGYTGYLEKVLGRAFIEQEWELYYDAFPTGELQIPLGDLISVTSVEYVDSTTLLYTTWDAANYEVDTFSLDGWIIPADSWPSAIAETSNALRVTFKAGYGDEMTDVPQAIRNAIGLLVVMSYDDPSGLDYKQPFDGLPLPVRSMISPYRRMSV